MRQPVGSLIPAIALLLAVAPAPASAETSPPEQPFELKVNTANGSGCRPGTYEVNRLPGNGGFQVVYSDFRASAGKGSSPTDFRKNCQVSVQILVPSGYTYAVLETETVGTADIAPGGNGLLRHSHYYAGAAPRPFVSHPFPSGYADNWQVTDTIDVSAQFWVWCDLAASLNSNVEARVARGTENETTSFLTVKTVTYRFGWRRCAGS
ncbi:hypothetical protein JOF56_008379 [Kibdelosporangium banguiense]|uniref:DUF4360 domain-containing protein n=1 Tax=Kibdelosporangium banguiense TaxID=1365924 RepID=A0ABS4TUA3_9PSEU|nr:DUF4360 domain-containing protein [Kibdelosporangium banguiense]MBP2327994.1 hypothetical protein [Kibdelosporangium banguiense]